MTESSHITIRQAVESDLALLWFIRTQAIRIGCSKHYSAELVEAWASVRMPVGFVHALRETEFFAAEMDGTVQGFGFMNAATEDVEGIFVSPQLHRRGIGSLVLATLERRACELEVRRLKLNASLNAEAFYRSSGYMALERSAWNHPNGFVLPCVIMEKVLVEPSH